MVERKRGNNTKTWGTQIITVTGLQIHWLLLTGQSSWGNFITSMVPNILDSGELGT